MNSGNIVEFTMWDQMAEDFEKHRLEAMEQPVIIAINSCRVERFRGICLKLHQTITCNQ
jgi:hypothetical protein